MTCLDPRVASAPEFHTARAHSALVIDDEERIRSVVIRALQLEGIAADGAGNGDAALAMLAARPYDLVVLDLLMPGRDGFATLHEIMRLNPDQAVLVLSCLSDVPAKIRGLNLGAEDYLAKPFDVDELFARLRALRRRHLDTARLLPLPGWRLDLDSRTADPTGDGEPVRLSERECDLLATLATRPSRVYSRRDLLNLVFPDAASEIVVDTYVHYLRRKLGRDVVATVRGRGYQLGRPA